MKDGNPGLRRRLLLAAGLAVATGAWLWLTQQELDLGIAESAPVPTAKVTAEVRAPDAAQAEQAPGRVDAERIAGQPPPLAATSASAPLPIDHLNIPVVQLLDLLGERARGGDPTAACRLAHALNECRRHALATRARAAFIPRQPPSDPGELERHIEWEATRQEQTDRLAQRCAGLDTAAMREGLVFSASAALAGHSESLTAFLRAPSTSSPDFILNPQVGEIYRTQLWPALLRSLRAGDAQVARALIIELANPTPSSIQAAVPEQYQDSEVALAVLALLLSEEPALMHSLAARKPPSVEAEAAATLWVDELFGGRLPALPAKPRAALTTTLGSPDTCESPEAWPDTR